MRFEIDDAEALWTYGEKFDLVFIRYLAAAIADWPRLVGQAFDMTMPGGFTELQDFELTYYADDGSFREDTALYKWMRTLLDASISFGRDPNPGSKLEGWLKQAGFEDVVHERFVIPIGPWANDKHLVRLPPHMIIPKRFRNDSRREEWTEW